MFRDEVETRLVSEVVEIRKMVEYLQKMLQEVNRFNWISYLDNFKNFSHS